MDALLDFSKISKSKDYFFVATEKGFSSYASSFLKDIPEERLFLAPGGEASKTFSVYEKLLLKIANANLLRGGLIVGIGGGALLDLAGFAAATYLRGVDFCAIPTTFLAMIDAAIGGKTAINLPCGKNLVGAFAEPKQIVTHFPFLDTLSPQEYSNGWSESLKMALIRGDELWEFLATHKKPQRESLAEIVRLCQAFKRSITAEDFRENLKHRVGRAQLNFGHTLGHALECSMNYSLPHGEAVALGMRFALWLSCRYAGLDLSVYDKVKDLFTAYGLPKCLPKVTRKSILDALLHDKKRFNGQLQWVLLEKIGQPILKQLNDQETQKALEEWWALSDSNR